MRTLLLQRDAIAALKLSQLSLSPHGIVQALALLHLHNSFRPLQAIFAGFG